MYFIAFLSQQQRGYSGCNRQRVFLTYSKFNALKRFIAVYWKHIFNQFHNDKFPPHYTRVYHTRLDKTPNIYAKHTARDLLLNNECLRTTIAPFFLFRTIYYLYVWFFFYLSLFGAPCSCIISIKWFHCVNTSWPLQRLKGLFLFHSYTHTRCVSEVGTPKGWPVCLTSDMGGGGIRRNTLWKKNREQWLNARI